MSKTISLALSALCVASVARAQSTQNTPSKPKPRAATEKKTKAEPADPAEEARRTTAVLILKSLGDEARDFHDHTLRARVQTQVADKFWDVERVRARELFRRAWEAAVTADRENERRRDEDVAEQLRRRGSATHGDIPRLKAEVLRLTARRDAALTEEFLKGLAEERKRGEEERNEQTDSQTASLQRAPSFEAPVEFKQRLDLAREFLLTGDAARAVEFAAPALGQVTKEAIGFLSFLRLTDAALADRRYAQLLARAAADPQADANTVSLLSSYAFTPGFYLIVMRTGGSSSQSGDAFPAPALSPELRAAFFRTAAQILLRPLAPPEQDRSTAGRYGTLTIASRLLPLFERHAPEFAGLLNARASNLRDELPEHLKPVQPSLLTSGFTSDQTADTPPVAPSAGHEEDSEAERDETEDADSPRLRPEERDFKYAQRAMRLSSNGDLTARDFADRIADSDLRKQLREYVDFDLARGARETEAALELARSPYIPPLRRVWLMTEIAHGVADEEPARAVGILEEAAAEARRIEPGDADRARALAAVAARLFEVDRERVWLVVNELVKSANSAEEFTGRDTSIITRVEGKNFSTISEHPAPQFDLAGIFARLAEADLQRAVEHARAFTGESPRAAATLAVALAVLDKKRQK